MSLLRAPGLGPIIGHTTDRSCRLWIRAASPAGSEQDLTADWRTVGVLGLLTPDKKDIKHAYYFRLHREFDRTGTFFLGEDVALGKYVTDVDDKRNADKPERLEPDTEYTVRMATLSMDDTMLKAETLSDRHLAGLLPPIDNVASQLLDLDENLCEATFRTFPEATAPLDSLSFLVGSCRYPGLLWKVKEADGIFGPMYDHVKREGAGTAARFVLMVGDQIYADELNRMLPIGRADTYIEFQNRYKEALGAPNMRRLLRATSAYMILDDHEIEDNWTQDRLTHGGKHQLFNFAIGAYMSYQWSHGPKNHEGQLHYDFVCGGYPYFVLDTRTQRFKDDEEGLRDNHLLGRPSIDKTHPGQLQLLLTWLSAQQNASKNVPKFIVTSSVFAPNPIKERIKAKVEKTDEMLFDVNEKRRNKSDSWPAYPNTRKAIVDHIVKNEIQNVVFLSGDIHCSNIAHIYFETGGKNLGLYAYDITSSAFYWPFPFADGDPNNYVHDSTADNQLDPFPFGSEEKFGKNAMHYRAWAFTQQDNFCRIDIDKASHTLRISYFDRKGKPIEVTDDEGRKVTVNSVELAEW